MRTIKEFFRGIGYGISNVFDWFKDFFLDIGSSTARTSRNIVLTSFFWVIILGLALSVSTGIVIWNTVDNRKDQQMAKYWQNNSEMAYRQMSVFGKGVGAVSFPKTAPNSTDYLTLESIATVRTNISNKITENSKNSSKNESNKKGNKNAKKDKSWTDCYSTTFDASACYNQTRVINGEKDIQSIPFNCNVVAVGGNFKAFHPYEYLDGGFLPEDEFDTNICVINDSLAWKLFKSYNVCGEKIELFAEEYLIIGVVAERDTDIDKKTGASDYRVFCYFSKMSDINSKGGFDIGDTPEGATHDPLAILCYEAMLPEIVKGVARNDVLSSLPSYNASEPQFIIVSNTGRFGITKVYSENVPIGEHDKLYSQFQFPYWEKATQLANQRLFVEGIIFIAGIVLIFIGIVICILRFGKVTKDTVRKPNLDDLVFDEN